MYKEKASARSTQACRRGANGAIDSLASALLQFSKKNRQLRLILLHSHSSGLAGRVPETVAPGLLRRRRTGPLSTLLSNKNGPILIIHGSKECEQVFQI